MSLFSNIMVGLDLTETDKAIVGFMNNFVKIVPGTRAIYFVHVKKEVELPDEISEKYGDELILSDEAILEQMRNEVVKYTWGKDVDFSFNLLEGEPLKQLLLWSKEKSVDLIIAGKKKSVQDTGIIMEKMARKSSCSILFVTEGFSNRFKRFLVPIDFSKRTDFVIEKVYEMSRNIPDAELIFLNVVDVPVGYYKIGKTFEEFAEIMKEHARKRWTKFKLEHQLENLPADCEFVVNEKENIAKVIFDYARENQIDMIMMASKDQTDASILLLGSVAEKVITYDYDIPLLLIKKPGDVLDFFDAMKRI